MRDTIHFGWNFGGGGFMTEDVAFNHALFATLDCLFA